MNDHDNTSKEYIRQTLLCLWPLLTIFHSFGWILMCVIRPVVIMLPSDNSQHVKCSCGGQRKWFKDTLQASLKAFSTNCNQWEQAAVDIDQSGVHLFAVVHLRPMKWTGLLQLINVTRKEEQRLHIPSSSHDSLSILHQNLLSIASLHASVGAEMATLGEPLMMISHSCRMTTDRWSSSHRWTHTLWWHPN